MTIIKYCVEITKPTILVVGQCQIMASALEVIRGEEEKQLNIIYKNMPLCDSY